MVKLTTIENEVAGIELLSMGHVSEAERLGVTGIVFKDKLPDGFVPLFIKKKDRVYTTVKNKVAGIERLYDSDLFGRPLKHAILLKDKLPDGFDPLFIKGMNEPSTT